MTAPAIAAAHVASRTVGLAVARRVGSALVVGGLEAGFAALSARRLRRQLKRDGFGQGLDSSLELLPDRADSLGDLPL